MTLYLAREDSVATLTADPGVTPHVPEDMTQVSHADYLVQRDEILSVIPDVPGL